MGPFLAPRPFALQRTDTYFLRELSRYPLGFRFYALRDENYLSLTIYFMIYKSPQFTFSMVAHGHIT
jgi:hypothetical protein